MKKYIEDGIKLAKEIRLSESPYSEYNVAFLHNQVEGRLAYRFCLYENNKRIKYEVVLVHRYLMSLKLGRKLTYNEVVHHIDGDRKNNCEENLQVMSRKEHSSLHYPKEGLFNPNGPWNKGLRNCFSEESLEKIRVSAIRRHSKERGV